MYDLLKTIMIENLQLDADSVYPGASREDAGLDSLAVVELSMVLSQRLGVDITDDELLELKTVADIAQLMEQRSAGARSLESERCQGNEKSTTRPGTTSADSSSHVRR